MATPGPWAPTGTARGSTSQCSRTMLSAWTCACSTRVVRAKCSALRCPNAVTTCGMATCPVRRRASSMVFGLMVPGDPIAAIAQRAQAAARPVCAGDRRALRVARRTLCRRPPACGAARSARQRRPCAQGTRGGGPRFFGLRSAAAHAGRTHRALRGACEGLHPPAPGRARAAAWHYAGLASDAAIDHLQRLGITAVSLLPVHQHLDEQRLVTMGLTNYWGYNTIGFFCRTRHWRQVPTGCRYARSSARWCGACTRQASR